MKQRIVVAGGTGDLGGRIVRALLGEGAEVRVIMRSSSDPRKIEALRSLGAHPLLVANWNVEELSEACRGAACVVSALAGLREVIIDAQQLLVDAAVAAGVPRFIPSDYSLDFTRFRDGENRNLDLRRAFHRYLDKQPIQSTTIFNGAFMDLLSGQMPVILPQRKWVLYWGSADHRWGFTTMDDTAAFTAKAALDAAAPRYLYVAGDRISPRELRAVVSDLRGENYRLFRAGGPGLLKLIIRIAKTLAPAKEELYPAWQGMQYVHNMIDPRSDPPQLDNGRYPGFAWTRVKDFLRQQA